MGGPEIREGFAIPKGRRKGEEERVCVCHTQERGEPGFYCFDDPPVRPGDRCLYDDRNKYAKWY